MAKVMFIICQIYRFSSLCFGPWDRCCEVKLVINRDSNDDIDWLILFQIGQLFKYIPDSWFLFEGERDTLVCSEKHNEIQQDVAYYFNNE